MSRLLGPQDYGALGALLSAFVFISVPAGAFQIVVAKRVSILRAAGEPVATGLLLRALTRGAALFGLLLGGALAAAGPLIARFLKLDSVTPALILAGYVAVAVVAPVIRGALQGQIYFRALAGLSAGTTILRLLAGVVLVKTGWGLSGAVFASLLAEVAGVLFGFVPLTKLLKGVKGRANLKGLLREAQMAMLAFGGFWAVISFDTVLARHYFSPRVSGFYAAAAVAAHIVLFLPGAISMVAFPKFAESRGQSVEARRTLFHSIVAVGVLGFGAAAFLSIFSSISVRLLFGDAFLPAISALAPLATAMAFLGVTNILIYFHLSSGSKALISLLPAVLLEVIGIVVFHESMLQVAFVVLSVSIGLLVFNLIAAYAHPGDPRVQPIVKGELWEPQVAEVDLSVVTPAFNPGKAFKENLERLLHALTDSEITFEVIAVSDGSTDRSQEAAEVLRAKGVRLIHYDVNRGKGYALRMGMAKARGRYIAFIDSDGDLAPSELHSFVTLMKTYDVDLVVGSKRHPLSQVEYPMLRRVFSWIYHFLVRILFGIKLSDTQTGLKLVKREVLAEVLPRMLEKRFAFDLEMLVVARLLGFKKIMEAPIKLNFRFDSTISMKTATGTIIDTLAIFYRRFILRYYHQVPGQSGPDESSETSLPVEVVEIH